MRLRRPASTVAYQTQRGHKRAARPTPSTTVRDAGWRAGTPREGGSAGLAPLNPCSPTSPAAVCPLHCTARPPPPTPRSAYARCTVTRRKYDSATTPRRRKNKTECDERGRPGAVGRDGAHTRWPVVAHTGARVCPAPTLAAATASAARARDSPPAGRPAARAPAGRVGVKERRAGGTGRAAGAARVEERELRVACATGGCWTGGGCPRGAVGGRVRAAAAAARTARGCRRGWSLRWPRARFPAPRVSSGAAKTPCS